MSPESDLPIEIIRGRNFKIPTISSGPDGFRFDNLHLPIGWTKAREDLRKWFNSGSSAQAQLEKDCRAVDIQPGTIITDSRESAVLKEIKFADSEVSMDANGAFVASNVKDPREAIVMAKTISEFLNAISGSVEKRKDKKYPYIDIANKGFTSVGLSLDPEKVEKDSEAERRFLQAAEKTVKDFGLEFYHHVIDDGKLVVYGVKDGETVVLYGAHASYSTNFSYPLWRFEPVEEIKDPIEAICLHDIGAEFINQTSLSFL